MMQLSNDFKHYVKGKKYQNDIGKQERGEPYWSLFSYYRHSREFLQKRYKRKRGKDWWKQH